MGSSNKNSKPTRPKSSRGNRGASDSRNDPAMRKTQTY